jgi:hemerythrin-like domain-containing protein
MVRAGPADDDGAVKRSEALAALSRDHHEALVIALYLRAATPDTAHFAQSRFQKYFHERGSRHLEIEEEILLPFLEIYAQGKVFARRIREEHHQLRLLGERSSSAAGPVRATGHAHSLGHALRDHVRFEERDVFPFLESVLSHAELAEVARRLEDTA